MTDVALIQPPIEDFYLTAKRTYPYGLACLAASLRRAGFSACIVDGTATKRSRILPWPSEMEYLRPYYGERDLSPFALFHRFRHYGASFDALGRAAAESGAFLAGISSLFTPYAQEALKTAEAVKRASPQCKVVLGGHHPTAFPREVLQCPWVDFVVRGEGEEALPRLARVLREGGDLESVEGLAFRREDGTLRMPEPAVVRRLDACPPPELNSIDHGFYRRKGRPSVTVVAARGCPMACSYCCLGRNSPVPYRRRAVASVLAEVERAVDGLDAGFIDFEDENLSLDRAWTLELLQGVRDRFKGRGIELRAMNGLFPPALDEEILSAMKAAGFRTLNLSVGSFCPEQLRRFRRPDVRESFDKALELAEKEGLQAVGYLLAGAPRQRAEDSVKDLLALASRRVLAGASVFYPAPASDDYALCRREGLLPHSFSLMRSSALPLSHAATTREEAATLLRLARLLNFMKGLLDEGEPLPEPAPLLGEALDPGDRRRSGVELLAAFFHDGALRGLKPSGEVLEHRASRKLTAAFLKGLRSVRVRGTR